MEVEKSRRWKRRMRVWSLRLVANRRCDLGMMRFVCKWRALRNG